MWEAERVRLVKCCLTTLSRVIIPSLRFVRKGIRLLKLQRTQISPEMPIKSYKPPWCRHSYADRELSLLCLGRCRFTSRTASPPPSLSVTANMQCVHTSVFWRGPITWARSEVGVQMNCITSLTTAWQTLQLRTFKCWLVNQFSMLVFNSIYMCKINITCQPSAKLVTKEM